MKTVHKSIMLLFLLLFSLDSLKAAEEANPVKQNESVEKSEEVKQTEGAAWDSSKSTEKGATWNSSSEPVFYLFEPYHGHGPWVETPGRVFGAIGVIPGTLVGAVLAVPLMPFVDFERTVFASNTFFGQGFSMILASPFYVTKLIFWDVPKSWFD